MRYWTYPCIAIAFNCILFNSFHYGEYGTAIGIIVTLPFIVTTSLILTFVHYRIERKNVLPGKMFQIGASALIVVISYLMFPTQDSPISIIVKMTETKRHYNQITINDYFLENRYENYEKIVSAKKKFGKKLSDTAFSVNVSNRYDYKKHYKTYGIMFIENNPKATDKRVNIERISNEKSKFTDYLMGDTITVEGNKHEMRVRKLRTDGFTEFGTGHFKDTTLKEVEVEQIIKSQTPDERLWAYKVFYWMI